MTFSRTTGESRDDCLRAPGSLPVPESGLLHRTLLGGSARQFPDVGDYFGVASLYLSALVANDRQGADENAGAMVERGRSSAVINRRAMPGDVLSGGSGDRAGEHAGGSRVALAERGAGNTRSLPVGFASSFYCYAVRASSRS